MSETVSAPAVAAWMATFATAVAREREHLTELDAAIGDADHGINMERGMQAVLGRVAGASGAAGSLGSLLKTVGMTLVSTVGGAAGPLYGTLFLAMATAAGERDELSVVEWAATLQAGVAGVQARGKAEPGDKTMLDALDFQPKGAALPVELLLLPIKLGYKVTTHFIEYFDRVGVSTMNPFDTCKWTAWRIWRVWAGKHERKIA